MSTTPPSDNVPNEPPATSPSDPVDGPTTSPSSSPPVEDPEPSSTQQLPPTEEPSTTPLPPTSESTPSAPPTSTSPPPTTTEEQPSSSPTSAAPTTTSSTSAPPTSTEDSTTTTSASTSDETTRTSRSSVTEQTTFTSVVTNGDGISTLIVTETRVLEASPSSTTSSGSDPQPIGDNGNGGGGLDRGATVAIGVVVPIVAIAIIAIVGLFWWKRRRAKQAAAEERRKEVEDYSYNPNADPTIPVVGSGASDGPWEMREEGSSGYRGWGTTLAGSTGRKASTTMSGGVAGVAYSDTTSPTNGNASEARSGEPLIGDHMSGDGEILGAMGPSAANNRNGDVRRGASNASSYSAAGRSDGSDGPIGMGYGGGANYYEQYSQNPYSDDPRPAEAPGQAIIRDNPARRNTRIENPSHYPQGSVGISQNF